MYGRGTSSLNEFAERAKETACSAAGRKGHPDLKVRVACRADLSSEDVSQGLRQSAWAERLIEESSSQGCDWREQGTLAQPRRPRASTDKASS